MAGKYSFSPLYPAILPLAWAFFLSADVPAQIKLVDPCIPDSEVVIYSVTEDGSPRQSVYEERVFRKNDSAGCHYEISVHSSELELTAKTRPVDFFMYSIVSVNSFNKASIRRSLSLVENNTPLKADELGILDYSSLVISLRGFPFASCSEASLVLLGVQNNLGMKITNDGSERISASGKDIDCYKLELGLSGFWGKLLPKARFWYAAASPHQLVRYEGPKAGIGSPTRILELKEYTVKKH